MRVFNIKFRKGFLSTKKIKYILALLLAFSIPLTVLAINKMLNYEKIQKNIAIAGIQIGGLSKSEAVTKLNQSIEVNPTIDLTIDKQSFTIPTSELGLNYNFQASVEQASAFTNPSLVENIANMFSTEKAISYFPLVYSLDENALNQYTSVIAGQVSTKPINPTISLTGNEVSVSSGSPGNDLTSEELVKLIDEHIKFAKGENITTTTRFIDPTLTDEQLKQARVRGQKMATKSATIKSDDTDFVIANEDLLKLMNPKGGFYNIEIDELIKAVDTTFNRDPVNAIFNFKDGKVVEFAAAKTGVAVNDVKLKNELLTALTQLENPDDAAIDLELPAEITQPKITTQEVNNLGIKELIGKGESNFHHSIPSRIHNVALASSQFNGVLIPPGTVFSFNDVLGDVSSYTGYKQAYVIRDGKTVLGDGGGVCQVSTTMFRAILNAGLPIVERQAHSYRVTYYEEGYPPGIDATVYAPTTDLKFKNDTPGYILVQTITDLDNLHLTFELYGTSDGRIASITTPIVTSVTPPLEDLYIDDPTLPAGKIQQIDWKAWGAKVNFKYTVTRDGETLQSKIFYSNYQPWQAKFLRGTGPI